MNPRPTVLWFPWLGIEEGHAPPTLGEARVLSDEPAVWERELKRPRPTFLKSFRYFKEPDYKRSGGPAYGTVLISENAEWLHEFRDELAATLAFLAGSDGEQPSELFHYHCWRLADPANDQKLWSFSSRHAHMTEGNNSLHLFPPPALRGSMGQRRLATEAEYAQALVSLWASNPRSRVITAVKLSFRAEFGDQFSVTDDQYHTGKAAAVEAALNIVEPKLRAKFVDGLAKLFGDDPLEVAFYHGWYTARSLFVHGLGAESKKYVAAYKQFRQNRYAVQLTASLARSSILAALGEDVGEWVSWSRNHPRRWMQRSLHSAGRWDELASLLCKPKAADALAGAPPATWNRLGALAHEMAKAQYWSTVQPAPSKKKVGGALKTAWLLATRLNSSVGLVLSGDEEIRRSLVAAKASFESKDEREIIKWLGRHHSWARPPFGHKDRLRIALSLVWHLMRYFSPMYQDRST